MLRKVMLLAALALCSVGVGAGPAAGQTYAPPTVTMSDTTVFPGQVVTVSGTGAPPSSVVTISINPTFETTSDANGDWSTDITIPIDITPGQHTLSASARGTFLGTVTFTVLSPAGAEPSLPVTGSSSGTTNMARLAVLLLAGGGLFLAFGKRRSRRATAAPHA